MIQQFIVPIEGENSKRIRVSSSLNFSIGEVIRLTRDGDDMIVEKIVTIIDTMERIVFVSIG